MSLHPSFLTNLIRHKERERTGAAKIQWEPLVTSTRFHARVSTKRPTAGTAGFLIHTIDRVPEIQTRRLLSFLEEHKKNDPFDLDP